MWLAIRQIWRGWFIVLVVVAGLSALVLVQYRQRFAGVLDPASLLALTENPAIRTLFGTPVALDDPGGFTVWRTGTFAAVLVSAWGLLTATRISRGEERAGRWGPLLAGRLPPHRYDPVALAVLVAAQAMISGALSAAMITSAAAVAGSVMYGAAVSLVGVVFVALGMLTAQLLASRHTAAGLAGAVLAAALLVRMVADGFGSAVLPWVTPFGLVAGVRPFAGHEVAPLAVLAVVGAVLCVAAIPLARGRDLGAGRIGLPDTRPARTWLLPRRLGVRRGCVVPANRALAMSLTRF